MLDPDVGKTFTDHSNPFSGGPRQIQNSPLNEWATINHGDKD
jgi:hypothetical protein